LLKGGDVKGHNPNVGQEGVLLEHDQITIFLVAQWWRAESKEERKKKKKKEKNGRLKKIEKIEFEIIQNDGLWGGSRSPLSSMWKMGGLRSLWDEFQ